VAGAGAFSRILKSGPGCFFWLPSAGEIFSVSFSPHPDFEPKGACTLHRQFSFHLGAFYIITRKKDKSM